MAYIKYLNKFYRHARMEHVHNAWIKEKTFLPIHLKEVSMYKYVEFMNRLQGLHDMSKCQSARNLLHLQSQYVARHWCQNFGNWNGFVRQRSAPTCDAQQCLFSTRDWWSIIGKPVTCIPKLLPEALSIYRESGFSRVALGGISGGVWSSMICQMVSALCCYQLLAFPWCLKILSKLDDGNHE